MSFARFLRLDFKNSDIEWFDRSYATDWVVSTLLWLLAKAIDVRIPVFEREFLPDDPLIQYPHTQQQVSGFFNEFLAFWIPWTLVLAGGLGRGSLMEVHHGWLAIWTGSCLNSFVTEFIKNRVGRLRPDFMARCEWDAFANVCTGNADDIRDGRRSFPSGHSSTAFTGMTFVSLWIAGHTAAWCFKAPFPRRSLLSSRFVRIFISFVPLTWSLYVAITRVEDYRHHKEDIIVGSLIGICSQSLCYFVYWRNVFALSSFLPDVASQAVEIYRDDDYNSRPTRLAAAYELDGLQEESERV